MPNVFVLYYSACGHTEAMANAVAEGDREKRDSGWGRTGAESLKEFQDVIWINSHSGQRQYPI